MSVEQASKIVSMRPIIEQLIVKVSNQPQLIGDPNLVTAEHQKIINVIRSMARSDAGCHGIDFKFNKETPATNLSSNHKFRHKLMAYACDDMDLNEDSKRRGD